MSTWRTPTVTAAILFVLLAHVADRGLSAEPPATAPADSAVAAEPSGPLSLPDALALALMYSPELEVFSWEVRVGEARTLQAGKIPNPELDLRLYRLGIPRRNDPEDSGRTRVVLSQVFELGGKRRRRVALAGAEHRLAGWDYEAQRVLVGAEVARRFAAVLGAQHRVESWTDTVAFLRQTHKKVVRLVEAGTLGTLASHRSTRQIGIGRIELERARSELAAARFALVATWGGRSPQFARAVGDLEQIVPLPNLDTVIEMARQSPGVERWNAEAERGQAQLDLAKSSRVPNINYGVGMRWVSISDQRDYLVDLEFDLPIFDRKQGEIRQARYRMAQAEARRRATDAANSARIAETYFAMAESRSRSLTFAEEIVPASRATFEAFRSVFEVQADNLEDLLDARQELARDESRYASALEEYHRALATLEGLIGRSLATP